MGSGTQGKVYKIDSYRCIKTFKSRKECGEEVKTLVIAQTDSHFPKLYEYGEDYIIREYIKGIELDKYLIREKLTTEMLFKLVDLHEAMIKVGYSRLDAAIFHILVTDNGDLKLIDTAKCLKNETQIPNLLISGLEKLGFKKDLFEFLANNRPDLYRRWMKYTKINYKKKN